MTIRTIQPGIRWMNPKVKKHYSPLLNQDDRFTLCVHSLNKCQAWLIFLSFHLSACLFIHWSPLLVSPYLFVCMSVCSSFHRLSSLFIHLYICQVLCLSLCPSLFYISLSVHIFLCVCFHIFLPVCLIPQKICGGSFHQKVGGGGGLGWSGWHNLRASEIYLLLINEESLKGGCKTLRTYK